MRGLIISVCFLVAQTGCERIALDRQMDELCKIDGGVRVFETVTLSPDEFDDTGQPLYRFIAPGVQAEDWLGPEYRYVQRVKFISGVNADPEGGGGQLIQNYSAVIRRADQKILGEQVIYIRRGGDGFTFGLHPSSNACPEGGQGVIRQVFLRRSS